MDLFTTITGIASLLGAVISISQTARVKRYASEIKEFKKGLFNNISNGELSSLKIDLTSSANMLVSYSSGKKEGRNEADDMELYYFSLNSLNSKIECFQEPQKHKVINLHKMGMTEKMCLSNVYYAKKHLDIINLIIREMSKQQNDYLNK